jgi:hypothetical protein
MCFTYSNASGSLSDALQMITALFSNAPRTAASGRCILFPTSGAWPHTFLFRMFFYGIDQ